MSGKSSSDEKDSAVAPASLAGRLGALVARMERIVRHVASLGASARVVHPPQPVAPEELILELEIFRIGMSQASKSKSTRHLPVKEEETGASPVGAATV